MTTTLDLCSLTLHEVSERIRSKDVSPVEATEAALERIARLNPKLNSFITVMAEQAIEDARAAGGEIAAGRYRGPLHGVPVAVKDLCETKGVRTTAASTILADWVPDRDATVVRKLRDAGAVIVGKTNLHAWAFGATGVSSHIGAARNPWDTERITGGSSSGSANAVATGMCYAAIGSDTGGSIRMPASLCGIVGLKPTYGRVSLHGVLPLSWTLDHLGPMTRTVRDTAIVLSAIAGQDPDDPSTALQPVEDWPAALHGSLRAGEQQDFVPKMTRVAGDRERGPVDLRGLRIGVPATYVYSNIDLDVTRLFRKAVQTLTGLGADVREIELPILQDYWGNAGQILITEAATYHREYLEQRPNDYDADVRQRLEAGLQQKAVDYARALRFLELARRTCDEVLLKDLDLLAMPATRCAAVPFDSLKSDDPTLGLTRFTSPFDLTGQPAISVPGGFTDGGLPAGLQLVGRRFDEATVLLAAHAFELATGDTRRHPPVG
jgi:aspartyl-tRNA(Asn)/glutamyl-tRNA(Gln) amidotransferase subunit A